MGRNYDNWERLVEAVTRREQIRSLCLADSRSPSIRSIDSDYSFSSSSWHDNLSFRTTPSPSHTGQAKRRNAIWKGLPIFSDFSSKRGELQWVKAQRILHGIEPVKTVDVYCKQNNEEVSRTTEMAKKRAEVSLMTEMAKRKAEIARLRELHTLKGHIESIVKIKDLDIGSINLHYTI